MTDQPKDIAPAVVLSARDGFIGYMEKANPTPADLFEYMVSNNYVTLKFYVEMASGYDAV